MAWMRQRLRVTVALPNDKPASIPLFAGNSAQEPDGKWMLARDANLVVPEVNHGTE